MFLDTSIKSFNETKNIELFLRLPTNDRFHSLNAEIGQEDGEEDGEEVGDVLEWSQDLSHVSGLQNILNHSERHLCNKK